MGPFRRNNASGTAFRPFDGDYLPVAGHAAGNTLVVMAGRASFAVLAVFAHYPALGLTDPDGSGRTVGIVVATGLVCYVMARVVGARRELVLSPAASEIAGE